MSEVERDLRPSATFAFSHTPGRVRTYLELVLGLISGTIGLWGVAAIVGMSFALVPVATVFLVILALPSVVRGLRLFYIAGFLLGLGVWVLYFDRAQVGRCSAMGESCQIVSDPILPASLGAIGGGIVVALYAAISKSRARRERQGDLRR